MGLTAEMLMQGVDALAAREPAMAAALAEYGYPAPRLRERGYGTLLRTILGQQVSVAAAQSVWNRLDTLLDGAILDPRALLALQPDTLRTAGLSRQKAGYALGLADAVASGRIDLNDLPADDEAAIAALVSLKGIGRWSAEIYLLFAEGRADIWPAGDLAVQVAVGRILGLDTKPTEKETRALAEPWRPHRGAAAIFAWHHYQGGVPVG
ncbi:DNA-3-methyladenine glycosylase family protein [Sphingomonas sp. CJ99]